MRLFNLDRERERIQHAPFCDRNAKSKAALHLPLDLKVFSHRQGHKNKPSTDLCVSLQLVTGDPKISIYTKLLFCRLSHRLVHTKHVDNL